MSKILILILGLLLVASTLAKNRAGTPRTGGSASGGSDFESQLDKEDDSYQGPTPSFWDPKALKRVHYPEKDGPKKQSVKNLIKAQDNQYYYKKEFERSEDQASRDELAAKEAARKAQKEKEEAKRKEAQRTYEECYTLEYPDENGDDLKLTIAEETKSIIVTVWYKNYQNQWGQNLINQDVQGTLWKIICKHHPHAIYTEADLSNYNRYAYTYQDFAKEMDINVDNLYDSPIVTVLFDQAGYAFTTSNGPRDLVKTVDTFVHELEQKKFGESEPPCDVQHEVLADNHFEHYMPSSAVERYDPDKDETGHAQRQEKKVAVHVREESAPEPEEKPRFKLSEPEKSFT